MLIDQIFKNNEDYFKQSLEEEVLNTFSLHDDVDGTQQVYTHHEQLIDGGSSCDDHVYENDEGGSLEGEAVEDSETKEMMERMMKTGNNFNTKELEQILKNFKHQK